MSTISPLRLIVGMKALLRLLVDPVYFGALEATALALLEVTAELGGAAPQQRAQHSLLLGR